MAGRVWPADVAAHEWPRTLHAGGALSGRWPRCHVGTRVGRHVSRSGGLIKIVNRGKFSPIYPQCFPSFYPCGTMFPHDVYFAGRVAVLGALDFGSTAVIAWTRVHAIVDQDTC